MALTRFSTERREFDNVIICRADNTPTEAASSALAYAVLALVVGVLSFAISRLSSWPLVVVAVIGCLIYIALARFVLLVVNGDWLSLRGLEMLDRQSREAERNRHIETMARLKVERTLAERSGRLDRLELAQSSLSERILSTSDGAPVVVDPSSYVPAELDETRRLAREWLATLYRAEDGELNPDRVRLGSGLIWRRAPFSKRGDWNAATSADVKRWLLERDIIRIEGDSENVYIDLARFSHVRAVGRL